MLLPISHSDQLNKTIVGLLVHFVNTLGEIMVGMLQLAKKVVLIHSKLKLETLTCLQSSIISDSILLPAALIPSTKIQMTSADTLWSPPNHNNLILYFSYLFLYNNINNHLNNDFDLFDLLKDERFDEFFCILFIITLYYFYFYMY